MNEKTLKKLKSLLSHRRQELLEQVAHLEFEQEELGSRFIETIESAQKNNLTQIIHLLDERNKEEIVEIEIAFRKMSSGRYGKFELCGRSIPIKRLKVLPATRLCLNCAQKYEEDQKKRKHHRDEIIDDESLDEYRHLYEDSASTGTVKLLYDKNFLNL